MLGLKQAFAQIHSTLGKSAEGKVKIIQSLHTLPERPSVLRGKQGEPRPLVTAARWLRQTGPGREGGLVRSPPLRLEPRPLENTGAVGHVAAAS